MRLPMSFLCFGGASLLPFGNGEYLGVFEKIIRTLPLKVAFLLYDNCKHSFPQKKEKRNLYKKVQALLIIKYQFPKHFCRRGSYCGASGIEGLEITTRKRSKDLDRP